MTSRLPSLVRIMMPSDIEESVFSSDENKPLKTEDADAQRSENGQPEDRNRQFCFIIFNNPKWSQILRRHREDTVKQQAQTATSDSSIKKEHEEKKKLSLDDRFTIQLRHLFDDYMQHTR